MILRKTYFLYLMAILLAACKTSHEISRSGFENDVFGILGYDCKETQSADAIDSRVGKLDCGCVIFNYDYGKYSYRGPLTPEEEFRQSFDAYHHIKFFKNRRIDPKVNKLFLDSVHVVEVRHKQHSDDLIIPCEPCNTTAVLTFKGETFYYPVTMSERQLDKKGYNTEFNEKQTNLYKHYKIENESPGLFIEPIRNRFKKKNALSVTVDKATCDNETVSTILGAVYLKEKK